MAPAAASTFPAALAGRALTLDGGLATELERRGHDLSDRLWSARLLLDDPAAVVDAHLAFLRAGADVITSASYQATPEGFARAGLDRAQGSAMVRRSVDLARQARDRAGRATPVLVAGSVGPYGAMLADGSEYTGDYGPDVDLRALRRFHRPRLETLAAAGADVIAAETVPSLLEVEALALELDRLGRPAWLSLTTRTGPDGSVRTRRDEPAAEAFAIAAEVEAVVAVGVNCTDPRGLAATVAVAAAASRGPVIAYPNSGEGWDARARAWTGEPTFDPGEVRGWARAGARVIGGCCRVGPDEIARLARLLGADGDRAGHGGTRGPSERP
jgi:homocysteine S-methyltransferase